VLPTKQPDNKAARANMAISDETEKSSGFEAAGCEGKMAFPSYLAAKRVADRPRVKNPARLLIYRCAFCREFHLSSVSPKKKQKHGSRKKRTF
jgi:hypothetical protein